MWITLTSEAEQNGNQELGGEAGMGKYYTNVPEFQEDKKNKFQRLYCAGQGATVNTLQI